MQNFLMTVAAAAAAAAFALVLVVVVNRIARRLSGRSVLLAELVEHAHAPLRFTVVTLAVQFAVRFTTEHAAGATWRRSLLHFLVLVIIAAFGWLVASSVLALEDVTMARFRTDLADNRQARRVRTQVVILRRITVAVVVLLAAAVMLMTFDSVRAVGASLLASAGLAGVIAGLAAQSLLGNVFAGLQLAFSDALRLDDVVVVEGEWGRIEEITLSYVVVRIWDDRRLILPTSYFTTKPFENWTRNRSEVTGTAVFDVDWSVPVAAMRAELQRIVEDSDLWDGRVCGLQVIDATGGTVRVRATMSAADASKLWDLRCHVREQLVAWIREQEPIALPRMRAEVGDSVIEVGGNGTAEHNGRAPQQPAADRVALARDAEVGR
ncbi:MAG TPA: mechanosensitive ion channel family protein [Micromonosporaceae bacterium]